MEDKANKIVMYTVTFLGLQNFLLKHKLFGQQEGLHS